MDPAHIHDPANALRFLLAGHAVTTFRSHKTDKHFTYRVEQAEPRPGDRRSPPHFVAVLTAPDRYEFIGTIFDGKRFFHGAKSRIGRDAPSVKAFEWVFVRLLAGRVPETCDVYHEGKCGRCKRALTHPDSIETGLGPECLRKMTGG